MGSKKIRMWSWFINQIPKDNLEPWVWWFTLAAILLPVIGGMCGWIAFEMNDAATKNKETIWQKQINEAKAAALPKSVKVRLIDFLNALDARIIPELESGQTKFSGNMRSFQLEDLKKCVRSRKRHSISNWMFQGLLS
jgi:hypothetical protein